MVSDSPWYLIRLEPSTHPGERTFQFDDGGVGGGEGGGGDGGGDGGEGGGEGGGGGGDRGEGRAHLTLLVRPVRPSALWRWISAHEIRLSVG